MGDRDGMGVAGGAELVAGAFEIAADSVLGEPQDRGAFPDRLALSDPLQAFELARRQM